MKYKVAFFHIVITAFALSACASPATPTLMPEVTATVVSMPKIPFTPESIISLDERLLAAIKIDEHPLSTPQMVGNYPEEMVFVQGFIWTRTVNGHVVQIDPATNTILSAINVETIPHDLDHYCQGLGTDGEDIWACSARGSEDDRTIDVVRVDPAAQAVVQTFEVDKIYDQGYLVFLVNQIWVLTGKGDQLIGIDVTTNEITPAIDLGVRCFQLAVIDETLYATCAPDNLVLQIDPLKRKVTRRIDIKNPRLISGNENSLWIVGDRSIVRLDSKTLNPIVEFGPIGSVGDILVTNDAVWINQEGGFVYRIDPFSNKIIEQIKRSDYPYVGTLLVTIDSLWITDTEGYLLYRLSLPGQ